MNPSKQIYIFNDWNFAEYNAVLMKVVRNRKSYYKGLYNTFKI